MKCATAITAPVFPLLTIPSALPSFTRRIGHADDVGCRRDLDGQALVVVTPQFPLDFRRLAHQDHTHAVLARR
jgi:hypothetical protein